MNEDPVLMSFRYHGKRYTFKTPLKLKITRTPNKGSGQFSVWNQEFGIRGSDYYSLEDAIIEAEKDFVYRHGYLAGTEDGKLIHEGQEKKQRLLNLVKSIEDDNTIFHNPIGDKIKPEYNFGQIKITMRNSWRTPEKRVIINVEGMKNSASLPKEYREGYPRCSFDKCDDRLLDGYYCFAVQASNGKWIHEYEGPYSDDAVWYVNNSDDVSVEMAKIFIEEIGKCVDRLREINSRKE